MHQGILLPIVVISLSFTAQPSHSGDWAETGTGNGTLAGGGPGCGTLLMNSDSSYENAYCWQYGGIVPPDYGAFAECYSSTGARVCAAVFDLTTTGASDPARMDVYVWTSESGAPGAVLCTVPDIIPPPISFWPSLTRVRVDMPGACAPAGTWWVGYWGNWPGAQCHWFVGADLNDSSGCPMSKIAPGLGFPTGWQDVSLVWGPTGALGIGAEVVDTPVPIVDSTWGRVKTLYLF